MEVTFELPLMVEKTSQGNGELMLELKVHPVATCIDELSAGDAPEVARVTGEEDEWVVRYSAQHGYLLQLDHHLSPGDLIKFEKNGEPSLISFLQPESILCDLMPARAQERFWLAWHRAEGARLPRYTPGANSSDERASVALQLLNLLNETRRFKVVGGQLCLCVLEPYLAVTVALDVSVAFDFSQASAEIALYRLSEYDRAAAMLVKAQKADQDFLAKLGARPKAYYPVDEPVVWLSPDYPAGDLSAARAAATVIRLKRMMVKYLGGRNLEEVANAWTMFDSESKRLLIELLAIPDAQPRECFDPHIQALARSVLTIPGNRFLDRVIAYDPYLKTMFDTARAELLCG